MNAFRATERPVNERIKGNRSAGHYHRQVTNSLVIDCIMTSPPDTACVMRWAECKNLASVSNRDTER